MRLESLHPYLSACHHGVWLRPRTSRRENEDGERFASRARGRGRSGKERAAAAHASVRPAARPSTSYRLPLPSRSRTCRDTRAHARVRPTFPNRRPGLDGRASVRARRKIPGSFWPEGSLRTKLQLQANLSSFLHATSLSRAAAAATRAVGAHNDSSFLSFLAPNDHLRDTSSTMPPRHGKSTRARAGANTSTEPWAPLVRFGAATKLLQPQERDARHWNRPLLIFHTPSSFTATVHSPRLFLEPSPPSSCCTCSIPCHSSLPVFIRPRGSKGPLHSQYFSFNAAQHRQRWLNTRS